MYPTKSNLCKKGIVYYDLIISTNNCFREYTVPTLDCIPIEGLEPPMSRDTTFTSFLGGTQNTISNGTVYGQPNGSHNINEPC